MDGRPRTGDRGRETEDGRPRTGDLGQETEDRRPRTGDRGRGPLDRGRWAGAPIVPLAPPPQTGEGESPKLWARARESPADSETLGHGGSFYEQRAMRGSLLHPVAEHRHGRRARSGRRTAPAPRPDPASQRARDAGGPSDLATYACECGYLFAASVSTTVACPNCGIAQAW